MNTKRWIMVAAAMAVVSGGLVLAGCEKKEEPPAKSPVQRVADQASAAVGQAGDTVVTAILVAADAYDGASDKTIKKCLGCKLRMDGQPANTIVYADYTIWFCSPDCKKDFEQDTKKSILAMEVPKKN